MFGISVSKGKHTIFEIASDSKIIFPSSDSCVILSGITLGLILNTQSTHMQSLFWISVDITYSKNFNLEWCLELGEGGGGGGGGSVRGGGGILVMVGLFWNGGLIPLYELLDNSWKQLVTETMNSV